MASKYEVNEPYGHDSEKSKLERLWESLSFPSSIRRERGKKFDALSCITYSPTIFEVEELSIKDVNISSKDIRESFLSFVRDEFGENQHEHSRKKLPSIKEVEYINEYELLEIFNNTESRYYDDLDKIITKIKKEVGNIYKKENSIENDPSLMSRVIFEILCNNKFGSSKNKKNNDFEVFSAGITKQISEKKRLTFVVPGLPFKDQNIFRVPYSANQPDFSELSLITKLHLLTQAIYQVHPFGADIVVLTDGLLYSKIFDIPESDVKLYFDKIIRYRNLLNLQGTLSFIDIKVVMDKLNSSSNIERNIKGIANKITDLIGKYDDFDKSFHALEIAMIRNSNTRKLINEDLEELHDLIYSPIYNGKLANTKSSARDAAIQYAATNLYLRHSRLIEKLFPDAIRLTVHPKKGQFSINGSGGAYPWNGVAWSDNYVHSFNQISTKSYYELEKYNEIKAFRLIDTDEPAYFTNCDSSNKLLLASKVLKKNGWKIGNIIGREFKHEDYDELYALGKDDDGFNWEREITRPSYYLNLLDFRINHYKEHGFGVHGLWCEGKLIGQFGLQVDDESNRLEFVIFLGKEYKRQRIATKLGRYLFERCRAEGLYDISAKVRVDNNPARRLIETLGGKESGQGTHYNKKAIFYIFNLREV